VFWQRTEHNRLEGGAMRVEQRDDGAPVSGFLNTQADGHDAVLVRGAYPYRAEMMNSYLRLPRT
jgi:hypothetical protein